MNSIETMNFEIDSQRNILPSLHLPKLRNPERCIFVGSGDSYVSGLLSSYISGFRSLSFTPSEIITFPSIAKRHEVFFVSISGKTSANIRAAQVMNSHNIKTTAITADHNSPLAMTCKDVIRIEVPISSQLTSGTLTFSASALMCMGLVTKEVNTSLIPSIFLKCKKNLQEYANIIFNNCLYVFLANDFLFPCALYGKLKVNEIFGFQSNAHSIDEFFHAPLFSLRTKDCVFLFEKNMIKENDYESKIRKMLSKLKLKVVSVRSGNRSMFQNIMYSIIIQQMIFASQARKMGLRDCVFIKNKGFLSLSSDVIYHT
jgi:glutamine---fructose-6-phosphate transaminase (isomerizing)